ncbi:MAG: glycosyltransferase family 2 protein [Deltaproteobacteria bacterium]|nr:glycosyltransferase family 2 protein [Deltaproteobacteria bacterium]
MKVSVVIPVYNEAPFVEKVIARVLETGIPHEVIIVDDGSTDGTREILKAISEDRTTGANGKVHIYFQEKNMGKGAALRRGLKQMSGDVVIIQDADIEYSPRDYPRLLEPILDGRADVVYGSRFAGGESHRVLYFWHMVGNRFLTLFSNMLTNLSLTDMETCYKVFCKDVIDRIKIEENRFGFEPEITAKVAKLGVRIYEVGVSYAGRTYKEGKKVNWKDGFSALRCIIKYNLFR